jgi:hypothetical protein
MGRRTRKGRPEGAAAAPARPAGYARVEERNAAVRATLRPLAPDEHPTALRVAIAVAVLVGLSNLVLWAVGWEVDGRDPGLLGAGLFAALMFAAAWGMWQHKTWAALGFEALVGLVALSAASGLVVSSNLTAAGLSLLVLVLSVWMFWKMVRVLGRLQAPTPPQ